MVVWFGIKEYGNVVGGLVDGLVSTGYQVIGMVVLGTLET
jgi:hypothetical protein